ncbi:HMG-box (High mobility group) DNA-binding family protein [Rhynchospora pubera]|uniref:HMG-box (High mobility group) DNA-binding family protein n=1 Tax=Rhynchospora pubera TaxID=906938 RepID=A0AAV8FJL3_9POAL|nr:HMG-box (High mobility group) DNA-binding family protein [Rhynchospora pubera]
MARKRVHALSPLLRAPDGSAFTNCEVCGVSVPIALVDMHDCVELKVRRRRNTVEKRLLRIEKESMEKSASNFKDQPRSAFCFFMEEFSKNCEGDILIEVSERGFETWKNMSIEERTPYLKQASTVDMIYELKLRWEEMFYKKKYEGPSESKSYSSN